MTPTGKRIRGSIRMAAIEIAIQDVVFEKHRGRRMTTDERCAAILGYVVARHCDDETLKLVLGDEAWNQLVETISRNNGMAS